MGALATLSSRLFVHSCVAVRHGGGIHVRSVVGLLGGASKYSVHVQYMGTECPGLPLSRGLSGASHHEFELVQKTAKMGNAAGALGMALAIASVIMGSEVC